MSHRRRIDPRALWARLVDGLWFVPSVMVAAALVLGVAMVELSAAVNAETLARWPRIFGASPEGSRSILGAIAGSMITVAGVTFSITMVAVTQASSQYTPRILRNFMRDRANQVVLGVFVGIFSYCVVVLRTIRGGDGSFVPHLAVLLGVLFAIVGIGVLIFFVHHIANTLEASEIISRISHETCEVIERMFPDRLDEPATGCPDPTHVPYPELPFDRWMPIRAPATGYLQRLDARHVARVARESALVIRLERQVGEFTVAGQRLGWVTAYTDRSSVVEAARDLAAAFTIGRYRTTDQDPGFGIRQLVDIALKALSPGVNDPATAVTCVDYLGAIVAHAAPRRLEPPFRREPEAPVDAPGPSFDSIVTNAFDEIRREAAGSVNVLARQMDVLAMLGDLTPPSRRPALLAHVDALELAAQRSVDTGSDLEHLRERVRRARRALTPADR